MPGIMTASLAVIGAAAAAILLVEVSHKLLVRMGRRSTLAADLARTAHRPFLAVLTLFAVQQALRASAVDFAARGGLLHGLVIAFIAAFAWLVAALLLVFEDVALSRWRTDVPDNLRRRRLKTQVVMLRRVTVAAIAIIALGVVLMTFPGIRAIGASVLASAGLISAIAALAAQSTLGNVFAGLQLAFSDAVRVDDVVVVQQEWGRIEELTLTYVVVQVWDDRRLLLPTSYFTTQPFENWTRTGSAVLGVVEFDADFGLDIEPVRGELRAVCESSPLWDKRVCVLQVTDAVGGMLRMRALVSAADAPSLWDLRCLVRERLVTFIWQHQPAALPPRTRTDFTSNAVSRTPANASAPRERATVPSSRNRAPVSDDAQLFSGDGDGEARRAVFAGPDEPAPVAGPDEPAPVAGPDEPAPVADDPDLFALADSPVPVTAGTGYRQQD